MAKLTKDFYAVSSVKGDGIYPKTFETGSECPSDLEHVALELGYIEKLPRENKMVKKSPENKMIKAAPENKARK